MALRASLIAGKLLATGKKRVPCPNEMMGEVRTVYAAVARRFQNNASESAAVGITGHPLSFE